MKIFKKYYKHIQVIIIGAILLFILASIIKLQIINTDKIDAKKGVADLTEWENSGRKTLPISGEWEFYWKKLLEYKDIKAGKEIPIFGEVPAVWTNYTNQNNDITGKGYGTYRLHIKNIRAGEKFALHISPQSTAYKVYIDEKLVAESGVVSKNEEKSKGEYKLKVVNVTPEKSEFDIIVQISNYKYARGGLWYSLEIGTPENIFSRNENIAMRDAFLIGCFLIILVNSLFVYLIRKKERSRLFLAIMCIGAIGRTLVYSSYIITKVPILANIDIMVKLEYISLSWLIMIFMILSNSQFPNLINKNLRKVTMSYLIFYTMLVIVLPINIFTNFIYIMEIVCMLAGLYTTVKLFQYSINGNRDTLFLAIASTIYMVCGTHDIFLHNNLLVGASIEHQPAGFLFFLIAESLVISKNYAMALEENEKAIIKIEEISKSERELELKFLKSQIRPHFIHNALNAIISVSRRDPDRARNLLLDFSHYLRTNFDFEHLDNLVCLEQEIDFIKSYIAIEKARFGDKLIIEYEIEDIKILVPQIILQPLVENAVVHGMRTNKDFVKIKIYVKKDETNVKLGVIDNGTGVSEEKIREIYEDRGSRRGVGLRNINRRLKKIYGTNIKIKNIESGGCDIYITIPLVEEGLK